MSTDWTGKTVLVTGATGFLGGALARRLAAEGAQVHALARNPQRTSYIRDIENIEIVSGDINDPERMLDITEGCHFVFHVAAATNGPLSLQRQVNVEGTRHVALAAAQAGVERLVHVSSIATYGFEHQGIISEDTSLKPHRDPYNVSKAEGEAVLRQIGQAHHLPYSIIRPGMIYGPRSGAWTGLLFRVGRIQPTPWLGDGSGSPQPIYVDDVIEQMLIQATRPQAVNEAFNATPDPPPSWREFIGAYSRLAGHDRWLAIPPILGTVSAPLIEALFRLRGEPKDLPQIIPYVQRKTVYSMEKARRLLDWTPQVDLQTGIAACVPWLLEQGLLS